MHKDRLITVLFVILVSIMIVGEAMVYVANPYHYSSSIDGDQYDVYSSVSADFRIIEYDNPTELDEIFVYFDEEYATLTTVKQSDAAEMVKELSIRGKDAKIVDSSGIVSGINSSTISKAAVIFIDGEMPDTVYTGNPTDPIFSWLNSGLNVYWIGPTIGKYYSTTSGIQSVDSTRYSLFFEESEICESEDDEKTATTPDSGIGKSLCLRNTSCSFGLKTTVGNSLNLGFVSDDGYSSVSMVKFYNGQLTIFGGKYGDEIRSDAAQVVASGISYQSSMIQEYNVHCNHNHATGQITIASNAGAYVFCGGYLACYGKSYAL